MGNTTSSSLAFSQRKRIVKEHDHTARNKVYEPLDSARSEIRICQIVPAPSGNLIECKLERVSLDDNPQYTCLSYAWGKHDSAAQIALNGQVVPITANLHLILDHLQGSAQGRCFWIDVICIDQSNGHEKGKQVALMGQIYRKAAEVFVWLGPQMRSLHDKAEPDVVSGASDVEDEVYNASEAVEMLGLLADGMHFHELPYFGRCLSETCRSTTADPTKSWYAAAESLIALLEVPWFTRTWVVQEIVLARKAVLMHGEYSLSWDVFATAWKYWDEHSKSCCADCVSTLSEPDYTLLHQLDWQVPDFVDMRQQKTSETSLLRLLQGFRGRKATDGRDKIYGMLGLISDDSLLEITPNYEASVVDVYTSFAAQLIEVHGWLLPLHLQLEHSIPGLPSWVPDWTFCDNDPVGYSLARLAQAPSYRAGSMTGAQAPLIVGKMIVVEGTKVDTVQKMSSVFTLKDREEEHLNLILSWRDFLDLDQRKNDEYICGGTLFEAYQITMFADRYEDESGLRSLTTDDFDAWERHLRDATRRLRGDGPSMAAKLDPSMSSHNIAVLRRRLCVLAKGYIGLCPARTEIGDEVYVLDHSPAPIFLRPISSNGGMRTVHETFRALGHGYVHGIMNGEVANMGLPSCRVCIV